MNDSPHRVIKLGGSLLDLEGLGQVLRRWIATQPPLGNVVIAGGGALVDGLRQLSTRHALDERTSHRLAIRSMSITARVVAAVIGNQSVTSNLSVLLSRMSCNSIRVFDPFELFCSEETAADFDLPESWEVTSDTIAACVAERTGAKELVLLKSGLPENCSSWQEAADTGFVDRHFPCVVDRLNAVRCVNLRETAAASLSPASAAAS